MMMTRYRPDYREAILALLAEHGPQRFAQLLHRITAAQGGAPVAEASLDYDLRTLRQRGRVRSAAGLWTLTS